MTLKHGWQKLKLNDDKTALLPPFFLYLSLPPFPYLSRLLSVVTTSLSFILLGTLGSFLTQNYSRRNTSERSVKPLISSSNVLVQSADFSLKMQPKLLLPPTSSHGFITVTVFSWAHPILSSNLQKVQNFAARLILMAPRHHQSTPLLKKAALAFHFREH